MLFQKVSGLLLQYFNCSLSFFFLALLIDLAISMKCRDENYNPILFSCKENGGF